MRLSFNGHIEVLSHEAVVNSPYLDTSRVWTIAVGHTAAAGPPDPKGLIGDVLSLEECLQIFADDVRTFERAVHRFITVAMTQTEFDAWFSFIFNTGGKNRKTGRPYTCIPKFNAGDKEAAYRAMMTVNNRGVLTKRRRLEVELMRHGIYSNDGRVSFYPADMQGNVLWGSGRRVDVSQELRRVLAVAPVRPAPSVPKPPEKATLWGFLSGLFAKWSGRNT